MSNWNDTIENDMVRGCWCVRKGRRKPRRAEVQDESGWSQMVGRKAKEKKMKKN